MMSEYILSLADNNGMLPWQTALKIVIYHQLKADFLSDFREYNSQEINADLLTRWLGY